jgi:hypothetical protein
VAIAGFFAATIAWGNRRSIVADAQALLVRMDDAPAAFVRGATEAEVLILGEGTPGCRSLAIRWS